MCNALPLPVFIVIQLVEFLVSEHLSVLRSIASLTTRVVLLKLHNAIISWILMKSFIVNIFANRSFCVGCNPFKYDNFEFSYKHNILKYFILQSATPSAPNRSYSYKYSFC